MSPRKQKLLDLEMTGQYVFHGSGDLLDKLEPRQAYNFQNGLQEADGMPAIFASTVADYAILMAIINDINCPTGYHSSAGTFAGKLTFRATQATLDQLKPESCGWVYVCNKEQFTQRDKNGLEYTSSAMVFPIEKIQVCKEDLPTAIEIFK